MRELPAPFLKMIQDDIERISNSLTDNSSNQWQLFRELDGRYQACIKDWYKGMWQSTPDGSKLYFNVLEDQPHQITDNLKFIKAKLETFQYQMNAVSLPDLPATQVNVTTNVGVNITFEQVRSQVEDMSSLTTEQTQEVLEKIKEIEETVKSTDNKKTKWEKVKPILKWLADKSCDVGIALLPLILKIQN